MVYYIKNIKLWSFQSIVGVMECNIGHGIILCPSP